jgi:phosphoribosyl-ATP pyrophosphohydrolase/phosphoribosyl-AMP cyclohydrolase
MTPDARFTSDDLRFDDAGLIPAVVQDGRTRAVLMVAWMNREAADLTLATGRVHFWSRSRAELWEKGATSGNTMRALRVELDCDRDTVLVTVDPTGPACHTGSMSCFDDARPAGFADLETLWDTIRDRAARRPAGSYTTRLIAGGAQATGRKVLEEAAEVVEATIAHSERRADDARLAEEAADLIYHLLVLLAERDVSAGLVIDQLSKRRAPV